jgi:PAS domain S-box-containing protein
MNKIAFIAPDERLANKLELYISKNNVPVTVVQCYQANEVLRITEDTIAKGAKVIISRGGAASLLRGRINVPFIEMKITGFDMVNIIKEAMQHTNRIGVVGYENLVTGAELLKNIFPITLATARVHNNEEIKANVAKLTSQGIDLFIGCPIVINAAAENNVLGMLLETSDESISEAMLEATETLKLQFLEQEKTQIMKSILDSVYEGIIGIDAKSNVTVFNSKAEKFFGINADEIINKNINNILPEMGTQRTLQNGKVELGSYEIIGRTSLILNRIPIIVNEEIRGVVTTFQEAKNIQKIENQLRRKLLHKGYIAKATFEDIIGKSTAINKAILRAKRYSAVDSTVLIIGETGTGKELFAQSMHRISKRANKPFIAVNCAALPENLLESELFGYVEGAFTGAKKEGKAGLFELAHTGTIFLDEISEMSLAVQARFLRVLQEKEVTRIGDDGVIAVDIRIIAATNRQLLKLVKENKFREDLYYRLAVLSLEIPPLRDRREDIPLIADYFIHIKSLDLNKPIIGITANVLNLLMRYDWPGNVRQLLNILERSIILCDRKELDEDILTEAFSEMIYDKKHEDKKEKGMLKNMQMDTIKQVLQQSNGNKSLAARQLGVSTVTLWRKMKEFN